MLLLALLALFGATDAAAGCCAFFFLFAFLGLLGQSARRWPICLHSKHWMLDNDAAAADADEAVAEAATLSGGCSGAADCCEGAADAAAGAVAVAVAA